MKTLESIQKTMRVFQILTKIALVFSILGAAACALGGLFALTWYTGGEVFSLFGQPITPFVGMEDTNHAMAVLLSDLVFLSADAILLTFAQGYFKLEQAEGTPFTKKGAESIKKLGIHCIWMPIVAMAIVSVVLLCLGEEKGGEINNLPSVATGIVLILVSLIFRYGAELEEEKHARITDGAQ